MGLRGPPPKPSSLKLLSGNPGKRPLNTDEPQLGAADSAVPKGMKGAAKKEWLRLVDELKAKGLLTVGDIEGFRIYCMVVGDVADYEKLVRKVGAEAAHRLGYSSHLIKLRTQARQFQLALGLMPTTRGGVRPVKSSQANAAQAKRDRFFGNRGTGTA